MVNSSKENKMTKAIEKIKRALAVKTSAGRQLARIAARIAKNRKPWDEASETEIAEALPE